MAMIVDYLEGRGIKTKKKKPNEYSSACPICNDGEDRFITWPNENRCWCRVCGWKGDYIQLLMDLDKMSFKEAADKAGKRLDAPPPRRARSPQATPAHRRSDRRRRTRRSRPGKPPTARASRATARTTRRRSTCARLCLTGPTNGTVPTATTISSWATRGCVFQAIRCRSRTGR